MQRIFIQPFHRKNVDFKKILNAVNTIHTTVVLSGDPAGVVVYVLVKDKSRSIVGGSPRGGREERLWDMSMSAIEKKTSSSSKKQG